MSENITALQRQRAAIERQLRDALTKKIKHLLDKHKSEADWQTIEEIASDVLKKERVVRKDTELIYRAIQRIRQEFDLGAYHKLLICRKLRYGWARDQETVDSYTAGNMINGLQKTKSNIRRLPKAYDALGITANPQLLITSKLTEQGFEVVSND